MKEENGFFWGYSAPHGSGIRRVIAVAPVDFLCRSLAVRIADQVCGCIAVTQPYGRGQVGDDKQMSFQSVVSLLAHPNVAGVLLVGFEEKDMDPYREFIVQKGLPCRTLSIYRQGGEVNALGQGIEWAGELAGQASLLERKELSASLLHVAVIAQDQTPYVKTALDVRDILAATGIKTSGFSISRDGFAETVRTLQQLRDCHMIVGIGDFPRLYSPIVPLLHVSAGNGAFTDVTMNAASFSQESVALIVQSVLDASSGQMAYSEIVAEEYIVWGRRLNESI